MQTVTIRKTGTIDNGRTLWRDHNDWLIGQRDTALYAKPIPYPILLVMQELQEHFPGIGFWVSDEVKKQPNPPLDPFLMVRYEGLELIIERWNEPSFRG